VPFAAARLNEYADPTSPGLIELVVTDTGVVAAMTIEYACVSVWLAVSATWTVKF